MRGQRYEINISAKDNYYKVEVLKNGWRLLAAEGDPNNVLSRLNEVYNNRIDNIIKFLILFLFIIKFTNIINATFFTFWISCSTYVSTM